MGNLEWDTKTCQGSEARPGPMPFCGISAPLFAGRFSSNQLGILVSCSSKCNRLWESCHLQFVKPDITWDTLYEIHGHSSSSHMNQLVDLALCICRSHFSSSKEDRSPPCSLLCDQGSFSFHLGPGKRSQHHLKDESFCRWTRDNIDHIHKCHLGHQQPSSPQGGESLW